MHTVKIIILFVPIIIIIITLQSEDFFRVPSATYELSAYQKRRSIELLACADHLAIIEGSKKWAEISVYRLESAALKVGLRINQDKMEYMVVGRRDATRI